MPPDSNPERSHRPWFWTAREYTGDSDGPSSAACIAGLLATVTTHQHKCATLCRSRYQSQTLKLFILPIAHQDSSLCYTVHKRMSLSYRQHYLAIGRIYPIELPDVPICSATEDPSHVWRGCHRIYRSTVGCGDSGDDVVDRGAERLRAHRWSKRCSSLSIRSATRGRRGKKYCRMWL